MLFAHLGEDKRSDQTTILQMVNSFTLAVKKDIQ